MISKVVVFSLILVNVCSTEEQLTQPADDSLDGQSENDLIRSLKINDKPLTHSTPGASLSPMVGPIMLNGISLSIPTPPPIQSLIQKSKLDAGELLRKAYKGCLSLFEAIVIVFTALFQDGGLCSPNGLLSMLLYPLGAGGIYGQHGLLSQILYWMFRKDGVFGPEGLISILIRELTGCLRKLETEGLEGIGYSGVE